jgi:membrane protein DedA with SNARE-associated domain
MTDDALRPPHALDDEPLANPPQRRIVLDMPSWIPVEKVPRRVLIAIVTAFVLLVFAATIIPFATDWVTEEDFERYGYLGIFLANFLANATAFIPVPGLSAAAQALIIAGEDKLFWPGVVVAGASGMTLAESTAYGIGALGRGIIEEREAPADTRWKRLMSKAAARIDWLMAHYGFLTLFTLSAIPNPLFEFAGITAGAVRMNFWRFLLAVGMGKTVRVILLVLIGKALTDTFGLDL